VSRTRQTAVERFTGGRDRSPVERLAEVVAQHGKNLDSDIASVRSVVKAYHDDLHAELTQLHQRLARLESMGEQFLSAASGFFQMGEVAVRVKEEKARDKRVAEEINDATESSGR